MEQIWTQTDLRFCKNEGSKRSKINEKMRGQKDLKSMEKRVNWIENQYENLYKMLTICKIIHLGGGGGVEYHCQKLPEI